MKSIEIQLVRVETCGCAEGYAKDGGLALVLPLFSLGFTSFLQ